MAFFFRWIISTLIALLAVVFAISNMQEANLFFSPIHAPVTLPLSVIVLSALGVGFLLGGAFIWCVHGPFSKKADKKRAQVYGLIKENKKLQEEKAAQETISTPLLSSK